MTIKTNFEKGFYDNFYDKEKNIIKEDILTLGQRNDLIWFFNKNISSIIIVIESLEKLYVFLNKLFFTDAENDILTIRNIIDLLKKGKINEKEKYKEEIEELKNKYKKKEDKYKLYSYSNIFCSVHFDQKKENGNKKEKEEQLDTLKIIGKNKTR